MKKFKQKRALWYRGMKTLMKVRYHKPKFIYLGEKPTQNAIILSNHEGTDAPMSLEIYCDFPIRMWGTAEMNSGLRKMYAYQTQVYYHQKKHWNLHLARLFCLLASPLTNLFYKGLKLISTYTDGRFFKTIKESYSSIENGENIVIFPEISPDGYLEKLQGFYSGFLTLADYCLKKGNDISIFVSYYNKTKKTYTFSKPMKYSSLVSLYPKKSDLLTYLLNECNNLNPTPQEGQSA